MRIVGKYSHLNGEEYLRVHRSGLWAEVQEVIAEVDAVACRTKKTRKRTITGKMAGKMLYSPINMNTAFRKCLHVRGWRERRYTFWVANDEKLLRSIQDLPEDDQKKAIQDAGQEPIRSYHQTDFVKDRVAMEIQFGKYAFVAHDLFVKHLSFYACNMIDVGIEILPMKIMEDDMPVGVPYYERDLLNVIRQGRGIPAVPLVLIGVLP